MNKTSIIPTIDIPSCILNIRGTKVVIDVDLATLYEVPTKRLNQAIKRNPQRFPEDFVFELTDEETTEVVTKCDHLKNLKYSHAKPYAFTEHGALMAASVLSSPRAVAVSVYVVRAFVKMRELIGQQTELSAKLKELERRVGKHDTDIQVLVKAIQQLMTPPAPAKRKIGFHVARKEA